MPGTSQMASSGISSALRSKAYVAGSDVVPQPQVAHRVAVPAQVKRCVGVDFGDVLGHHGLEDQRLLRSPAR